MHDIEPYFRWRDYYVADQDERSPFYGREYSEFHFHNKIYNYMIHPQWDKFGSPTLYSKILYADYEQSFAVIEFIGEWNDCITNDVMYLKRNIIDPLIKEGIHKYILICENVLNFHGDDDCYYEEWWEEIIEEDGWISMLNLHMHVEDEMNNVQLDSYLYFGEMFDEVEWRKLTPIGLYLKIQDIIERPRTLKVH
jgi:hypothetical protein